MTFGSVAGGLPIGAPAYRAALAAVESLNARVLLTVGHAADVVALGSPPTNVHVEAWVAQDRVLRSATIVVCHGGSGTTFGALAAGVPLVIAPLWADQPANARAVAAAGAGLVVKPSGGGADRMQTLAPEDAQHLREAIDRVMATPSYRQAASRIAAEMATLPDIESMLDSLPRRS